MKMKIAAISIALSLGLLTSCGNEEKNPGNSTEAIAKEDQGHDADGHEGHDHGAGNEEKETHELGKIGAGPNKGIVVEAGEKNHMEMTINGKEVIFYPLDDLTNSIDTKGWTGKAIFQYVDGTSKTIELMMMNGGLTAMDANGGKDFTVIATLTLNGESIIGQFKNK